MGTSSKLTRHVARRRTHVCTWCGETIELGTLYARWRWYDCADASTCKMHVECEAAMQIECDAHGYGIEFTPGEYERGTQEDLAKVFGDDIPSARN